MKVIKKVLILLLIISICNIVPNISSTVEAISIGESMNSADEFLKTGNQVDKILNAQGVYDILNFLHGLLLIGAITYAVIKGTMIGMKIVLGTIEERVDAKAMLVPYLWIVAAIAFGEIILRAILKIIMAVID